MPKFEAYPNKAAPANNDILIIKDVTAGNTKQTTRGQFFSGSPLPTGSVGISAINGGNTAGVLQTDSSGNVSVFPSIQTSDWTPLNVIPTFVSSNGQREYVIRFPGVDYSNTIPLYSKLKGTRTIAAQTQSTKLNGTNQYWSKTSPAGMTFTNNFASGGWIYLTSYQTAIIDSRFNGTNGWELRIEASGVVSMFGYNGSAANLKNVQSIQSIPLNKWVHVTAQLDMSAITTNGTGLGSTTNYVMIDGVDVPATTFTGGTNPTALVQAGNYEIGSRNGGTNPFPGNKQNIWVSSGKLTQAQVRAFKDQKITNAMCTTYGLISAFTFDGNGNDANTTNANNLTANNSVTATDTNTALYTNIWGKVTKIAFTGGNTDVTVFCPYGAGVPNETLGAFSYSNTEKPLGFPTSKDKWGIYSIIKFATPQPTPTASTWYNINSWLLKLPTQGVFLASYQTTLYGDRTSGIVDMSATLSGSATAETGLPFKATVAANAVTYIAPQVVGSPQPVDTSVTNILYMIMQARIASLGSMYSALGDRADCYIYAEPAF